MTQPVERVTTPEPSKTLAKPKDPKKVAAGHAGAAARKAKQEKLLEEFRAAKETLCSDVSEKRRQDALSAPKELERGEPVSEAPAVQERDWTPWIIGAAGLGGIVLFQHLQPAAAQQHQKTAQSESRAPGDSTPKPVAKPPPCAKQLKVATDPFYME